MGSKFQKSPGGTTTTYIAPNGTDTSQAKRRLGADIIPSSTSSMQSDEFCAKTIKEMSELKRKYRTAVAKHEALEKITMKFITQLQDLVQARDGESDMMRQMLKSTPLKDVPIFMRPGIPEPSWCSEVKDRLAVAEAAALKGELFDLDYE